MSGNKFLLDTNIVLYVLGGNEDLTDLLYEQKLYISVITEMELLSFHRLTKHEIEKIKAFISEFEIISLDRKIKDAAIAIRRKYKFKLPDSIIAATALVNDLPLVTADKQLKSIEEISLLLY